MTAIEIIQHYCLTYPTDEAVKRLRQAMDDLKRAVDGLPPLCQKDLLNCAEPYDGDG
jgi:hypothetical protein